MRAANHSFSALVETSAQGSQCSGPLACPYFLPCSQFLKWTLRAKTFGYIWFSTFLAVWLKQHWLTAEESMCLLIISRKFSILVYSPKCKLWYSQDVNGPWFPEKCQYWFILQMQIVMLLSRHEQPLTQHRTALLGTGQQLRSTALPPTMWRLVWVPCVPHSCEPAHWRSSRSVLNYFSTWCCLVLSRSILSCKTEVVRVSSSGVCWEDDRSRCGGSAEPGAWCTGHIPV